MRARKLVCEECGASLEYGGHPVIECGYCGTHHVVGAAPPVATTSAPAPSGAASPAGAWRAASWGRVHVYGSWGTYSSTYRGTPGSLTLSEQPDGELVGEWGEGPRDHGAIALRVDESGSRARGWWDTHDDASRRTLELRRVVGPEHASRGHRRAFGGDPPANIDPELTDRLRGCWTGGGFGTVHLYGGWGTYDDTYGREPGWLVLRPTTDGAIEGRWGELDGRRFGTLRVRPADDDTLAGRWSGAPESELSPGRPVDRAFALERRPGPGSPRTGE